MKKKIIIIEAITLTSIILCTFFVYNFVKDRTKEKDKGKEKKKVVNKVNLMSFQQFSKISISNTESVDIIKYTIAGRSEENITNKEEITSIYNGLNTYKVGGTTDRACEDNTVVYKFNLVDKTSISIEIECEWLVIGKNRYVLE